MKRQDEEVKDEIQLKAERDARKKQKEQEKAAKEAAKLAKKLAAEEEQRAAAALLVKEANNYETEDFGYWPLITSQTRSVREWISVENVHEHIGKDIWIRGRLQDCRGKGSIAFCVIREQMNTVQLVLDTNHGVHKDMIKWACSVPIESIVDVYATVVKPDIDIQSTSQKVELQAKKIFCVGKAARELPFQLKDAMRPEHDETEGAIRVNLDTRIDNRVLDLRTLANQSIFRIQSATCQFFRQYLLGKGFTEIHSPKLIGGASEGGANCFTLKYFGKDACLAQSPQLYKQMAICGDMDRVFEIGPVFRAENSNTHRHMCEFTGLDVEMAFKEHYFEALDVLDDVFKKIFEGLSTECKKDIDVVNAQYKAEPFKWLPKTLRLDFKDGVQMLRDANCPNVPDDITEFDLSTEQERTLGQLVKAKYDTDYYILLRFPTKVRAFYTMPCPDDPTFSNSYDFFMRGEEIVSGAQRVHDPEKLLQRIIESGIKPETLASYVDAFRLGAPPHAGMGVGLERVVMLFLGLGNIRRCSLFPRDPKRLTP